MFDGDQGNLIQQLPNSPAFKVSKEEAWVTVWQGHERTEREFYAAVDKLEEGIRERKCTALWQICHLVGISIWLKNEVFLSKTKDEVKPCQKHDIWSSIYDGWGGYIDTIVSNLEVDQATVDIMKNDDSFYGFAVTRRESSEYQKVRNKLIEAVNDQFIVTAFQHVEALAEA